MIEAVLVMLVLGGSLGLGLGYASQKLYVEPDLGLEIVTNMLPGLNCGACGYPGCEGLASALVDKRTSKVTLCKPSSPAQREEISEYLKEYFASKGESTKASKLEPHPKTSKMTV